MKKAPDMFAGLKYLMAMLCTGFVLSIIAYSCSSCATIKKNIEHNYEAKANQHLLQRRRIK